MSVYHYIGLGVLILNTGISIGIFLGGRKAIKNDLVHMKAAIDWIKATVIEHVEKIAALEERTK